MDFLRVQLATLEAALAPRAPIDYNAEFAAQLAERKTSLTVERMPENAE